MGAFLLALAPLLAGITGPIKDWFSYKQQVSKDNNELELARIAANKEAIIQESKSDTEQRSNYLNATSQEFRQGTFYWMSAIILYSIVFSNQAEALWYNFSLIPQWVQYIYIGMLSVTWGLPIAKENIGLMFSSIGRGLEARRDYKIERAKINREAVYAALRAAPQFKEKGINQATVDLLEVALDAGESPK